MCNFTHRILLCEGCGCLTNNANFHEQCDSSKRTGRFGPSCQYFRLFVKLVIIQRSICVDRCYYCLMGRPSPAESNRRGMQLINSYIRRSLLTAVGWSRTGYRRRSDDIYGPTYIEVSWMAGAVQYAPPSYARLPN